MRLITLNVDWFQKNNDALENFLRQQQCDILCLQEVTERMDPETEEAYCSKNAIDRGAASLMSSFLGTSRIARDFRRDNHRGQRHFVHEFGGKLTFGNYTKTSLPMINGQNTFVHGLLTEFTDWSIWPETDPRSVAVTDVLIDTNQKLRVLNYHGIWSKDKRGNERTLDACRRLKKIALAADYPSIICGDFNLFPDTPSMQIFDEHFDNLPNVYGVRSTRPETNELSGKTRNVVDYILVKKGIRVNDFQVLTSDVSDHLPLLVDFSLS